jgi:hypothetical protein
MSTQLDRINELINKTDNIYNKNNNKIPSKNEIENIKNKFDVLDIYIYIKSEVIKLNDTIRYYNIEEPNKISISGMVSNIEYYSICNKKHVKTIYLYNPWTKLTWQINDLKKYIIFLKKYSVNKNYKIFKNILKKSSKSDIMNNIFLDEIAKYKKKLNKNT